MAGTVSKNWRIPQIDGLRCFSILFVVGVHLDLLPGGAIGVDIFFVISGYLITAILLREFQNSGSISITDFYVRRIVRIVPAFAVLLLIYAALIASAVQPQHRHDQYLALLFAGTYVMNWTRIAGFGSGIIGHTWSLAVEEQFYLVWPLFLSVIVAAARRRQIVIVSWLIAASFLWRAWLIFAFGHSATDHVFFGSDTRALQIFIGCLLAMIPLGMMSPIVARFWLIPVAILCILAIVGIPDWLAYLDSLIVALCAAWLISAVQMNERSLLSLSLKAKSVTWIGKVSYSLYLWHLPIIMILGSRTAMPHIAQMITAIMLSFGAAALSYYFVEKPVLRMRARHTYP